MVTTNKENTFNLLNSISVNEHTEEKEGLTYLSWSWAVSEVKKRCPDMTYKVHRYENGLPYVFDPNTGYMVSTEVTIDGITHEMWLPVMDGKNKTMKATPYTYKNKYGKEFTVNAATMFDVNKAIMRCLTKNFAMFGLGLYIYAGEDLPESEPTEPKKKTEPKKSTEEMQKDIERRKAEVAVNDGTAVKCYMCGNVIKEQTAKDGSVMTVADIVNFCKNDKRFGKPHCPECMKKKTANLKAREERNNA